LKAVFSMFEVALRPKPGKGFFFEALTLFSKPVYRRACRVSPFNKYAYSRPTGVTLKVASTVVSMQITTDFKGFDMVAKKQNAEWGIGDC